MRTATILFLSILSARAVAAEDKSKPGEFITEPANADLARVRVAHRRRRQPQRARRGVLPQDRASRRGRQGLPLLRIGNERINENALQYVTPNGFAGSIFDLEPATDYEARFVLSDPDGVERQGRADRHGSHARRTDAGRRRQGLSRLSSGL